MWDPYGEFQRTALPNGLIVHAANWPERPWEAVGFIVHSGAEHDPVGIEGLAHFTEHAVSENAGLPKKEMREFFEGYGGTVDFGRTAYSHTYYRFFVPFKKAVLSKAFSILGNMLLNAKLEKFVEQVREVIIGEFHFRYPIRFRFDLEMRERKALHSGCWLSRFVRPMGDCESIGKITQTDLQFFYDSYYTPANMSIVGVGGMTLSELSDVISESPFAAAKTGKKTPLPIPLISVTAPSETRHVFEMSKHITSPVEVGWYRSVVKVPGSFNVCKVRLLKDMLDEAIGEEVREQRSWTYDTVVARCNFRHFHELAIGCNSLALKSIDEIEDVVEACVDSMADREDLFDRVKAHALAGISMEDVPANTVRDIALSDLADYQRIISLEEYGKGLEAVTMADIRSLLKYLRPERRWTLITRP